MLVAYYKKGAETKALNQILFMALRLYLFSRMSLPFLSLDKDLGSRRPEGRDMKIRFRTFLPNLFVLVKRGILKDPHSKEKHKLATILLFKLIRHELKLNGQIP